MKKYQVKIKARDQPQKGVSIPVNIPYKVNIGSTPPPPPLIQYQ